MGKDNKIPFLVIDAFFVLVGGSFGIASILEGLHGDALLAILHFGVAAIILWRVLARRDP